MKRIIFILILLFAPAFAHAASLYISPSTLTLNEGQTGTFTVYVESASQPMNAVSGTVSVDAAGAALTAASTGGSIISFWASDPVPSGNTLSFEGVVTAPGYTGSAGRVLSFTVRAKSAGTYAARFLSGTVLANDGRGTDITSGLRGATLQVTAAPAVPTPPTIAEPEELEFEDTVPPVLIWLNPSDRIDLTDPIIRMRPEAEDEGTGVAGYEVSINGGPYMQLQLSGSVVRTAPLAPGEHTLLVRAVDGAGNVSTPREYTVAIEPLVRPTITFVTDEPTEDEPIIVSGTALPGTTAHVTFTKGNEVFDGGSVDVTEEGTFAILLAQGLNAGTYQLTVHVEDERGAQSLPTDPRTFTVTGQGVAGLMLLIAQVAGALVAVGAVIGGGIWLSLRLGTKIARQRRELMEEIRETDELTRRAFTLLRKDVASYGVYLKKEARRRELTQEERDFIEQLHEDLLDSERLIRRELSDVATAARKKNRGKE